ncbi:hypothetical protein [Nocardioides jishulii]|uniref:DUF2567 domain-containing protein n=1 Tax=Nocardioides jishulii TaxID=2575440 RepID=A0A4U2YKK0_9ACTN|nr:hypothetical protein [Nocardioides jishulii]QCX27194.1 hypothetical protein FCL41_06365 [Nocardioides jishulii]TKI61679.1 hypothetical protein FC770_13000 [Nocardioides jishulii]
MTSPEGPSEDHPQSDGRESWRRRALVLVGLLVVGAASGALLGVLWELVWTPPTGAAWKGEFYLDRSGLTEEVDATAWFTVIGLVGGLLLGGLAARFVRSSPLVVLAGVLLGALLQAWVMYLVGHLLGPPDPSALARTAGDWDPIVSDLRLAGVEHLWWPFASTAALAPAVGAMISVIGIFLGGTRRPRA